MKMIVLLLLLAIAHLAYAVVAFNQNDVNVTTTSVKVLNVNRERRYLLIQNKGETNVYAKMNAAHTGLEGVMIPPDGNWEPNAVPMDAIWLKSDSDSNNVQVLEGN